MHGRPGDMWRALSARVPSQLHWAARAAGRHRRMVLSRMRLRPHALLRLWRVWRRLRRPHHSQMLPWSLRPLLPCQVHILQECVRWKGRIVADRHEYMVQELVSVSNVFAGCMSAMVMCCCEIPSSSCRAYSAAYPNLWEMGSVVIAECLQ